jgi:prevent-host-death family protein
MIGFGCPHKISNRKAPILLTQARTMAISLTEDFKTLQELREDADSILAQVRCTGRPVVVTLDGKPEVVILDASVYESRLKAVNFAHLFAEAEAEVRAGLAWPMEKEMKDSGSGKKIPRANRAKR